MKKNPIRIKIFLLRGISRLMFKAWVVVFLCFFQLQSRAQDHGSLVSQIALQTIKSKNFTELAQNLFPVDSDRKDFVAFLKRHELLKRSLPDVVVEDATLTIQERSRRSTLDLSRLNEMKLIYNGVVIPVTGKESYRDLYLALVKVHNKKKASKWSLLVNEAEARPVIVIAVLTLASYAKAAIISVKNQPQ